MANLPLEMTEEILIRLPAKSLLRFRGVSKSGHSLISSALFVKSHIQRAHLLDNQKKYLISPTFLLSTRAFGKDGDCYISDSSSTIRLKYPSMQQQNFWIAGSCDGLLLLVHRIMVLWNPCTSEWHQLPNPCHARLCLVLYGFCYDALADDYMVIVGNIYGEDLDSFCDIDVMAYSLKSNSWRSIGRFYYGLSFIQTGRFLNGAIHWLSGRVVDDRGDRRVVTKIVALDLKEERVQEMQLPDNIQVRMFSDPLKVCKGCLCVLHLNDQEHPHLDLWIMKDYGISSSWTKLNSIPFAGPYFYNLILTYDQGLIIYTSDIIVTASFWDASLSYVETLLSSNPRLTRRKRKRRIA